MRALQSVVAILVLLSARPTTAVAATEDLCGTLQELRHPDGIHGIDGVARIDGTLYVLRVGWPTAEPRSIARSATVGSWGCLAASLATDPVTGAVIATTYDLRGCGVSVGGPCGGDASAPVGLELPVALLGAGLGVTALAGRRRPADLPIAARRPIVLPRRAASQPAARREGAAPTGAFGSQLRVRVLAMIAAGMRIASSRGNGRSGRTAESV